ncbi:MAG TPA: hypothetical protein DCE47_11830, partial [Planctomycetaceae bacterium]|nr:hypothetical protein [Planctomycetaceae bacterium]
SELSRLIVLNLSETRVSDQGLSFLEGLKSLKQLRLDGTRVTSDGVAPLRLALPGCKIAIRRIR